MSNYIKTGIYHLDVRDFEHEVTHLYEHLLIMSFEKVLEQHGLSKYLYGWISGHAFREVVFIDYGFYTPAVEKLFIDYMARPARIDFSLLENELLRIQAENEAVVERIDQDALIEQLKTIDKLTFTAHEHEFTPLFLGKSLDKTSSKVLSFRKMKKRFRALAVCFGAEDMDDSERLAFLRLTPIIYEAISTALFRVGMYERGTSWPISKPSVRGMIGVAEYSVSRGLLNSSRIEDYVRVAIDDLKHNLDEHPAELKCYIDGFVSTPNWNTFSIDYFENTGIIASKQQIYKVFTVGTVQSILSKIEIQITDVTDEHRSHINY